MYSNIECVVIIVTTGYGDLWFTVREKELHRGEYYSRWSTRAASEIIKQNYCRPALILCIYDTVLIRYVYHDRAGASPHLLLYYYYDTACLNPPGIYRSRGSTTAPSGTTTHTRFAHKILHYIIIICIWCIYPSAVISY